MSDLVRVLDAGERAQARLLEQYKDKPRLAAYLAAPADRYQELEDSLWLVNLAGNIDTDEDEDLNVDGEIVGQPRNGMADDEYRVFIKARIRANISDGSIEQLIEIVALILGDAAIIQVREFFPMAQQFQSYGVTVDGLILWRDFLKRAAQGGVNTDFIFSPLDYQHTLIGDSTTGGLSLLPTQCGGSSTDTPVGGGVGCCIFG